MKRINTSRFRIVILILLAAFCLAGCEKKERAGIHQPGQTDMAVKKEPLDVVPWTGKPEKGWEAYDRLVKEQKYEQASKLAENMLKKSGSAGNSEEWTRSLVRYVQLRTALHGYETAVRFLKEEAWPRDLLGRTALNLFYAQSLVTYAQSYSWEIRRRERVESKVAVNLKAWTMDQIYAETHRTYARIWEHREQLSDFPVSHMDEYVKPNNFPREIRGTLRDMISYAWVRLLSDTAGWRPEHSNTIYRLDLDDLMGDVKARPGKNLVAKISEDTEYHPLLKICLILDDLEKWHRDNKKTEAALEARFARLRILYYHFTGDSERKRIQQNLRDNLAPVRHLRWWSKGMAMLADFIRREEAHDALIRARSIARNGYQAFPESLGGRRCLHIIKSIEKPDFNLEGMKADGPGKRSLGARYKNLDKIYFRAYPVKLKEYIEQSDDYYLFPDRREIDTFLRTRTPSHEWDMDLAPTPDYKMHLAYSVPPMKEPGFYTVVASSRKDFQKNNNRIQAVHMLVTDLVLLSRQSGTRVEVDVMSGTSGRPVPGVRVYFYRFDYQNRHRLIKTNTTDKNGRVAFKGKDSRQYFLYARKGNQMAVDPDHIYLYPRTRPSETRAALIYTDRSIYRPLQTIHFKVLAYKGRQGTGNYRISPSARIAISLMDANNQEVAKKTVFTNANGTASGDFIIPAGRLLGQWRLKSSYKGHASIRVEEYKRPTFETRILDPDVPLRLNRKARIKGEARYYFGLPVTGGKVGWRIVRTPVFPWWWHHHSRRGGGRSARTQTIDAGTAKLEADGTFTISFVPRADERLAAEAKDLTFHYTLTADVTDEGGETRSAAKGFRLGFTAVEARVNMDTQFFLAGRPLDFSIARTDLNGAPAPGKGDVRVVALKTPETALLPADQPLPAPSSGYATPDDKQRPRWNPGYQPEAVMRLWNEDHEKIHAGLTHDDNGRADVHLSPLPAGAYRLHYITKDEHGSEFKVSREFLVVGRQSRPALPALLRVEKTSVRVGDTARIYAWSGLEDQWVVLDLYRNNERIKRQYLEMGKDDPLIEIPVTEAQRGGFGITLTVLRDHQFMQFSRNVFVPWDNKELRVEFSTFRDRLRPGSKEKWRVMVKGPAGKSPVHAAEVLAYMYDRSLDAFAGHYPPSPMSLFPVLTGSLRARSSLGVAQRIWIDSRGFGGVPSYPGLRDDMLEFFSGHGIGGPGRRLRKNKSLAMERAVMPSSPAETDSAEVQFFEAEATPEPEPAVAEAGEAEPEQRQAPRAPDIPVRADFSETAFWQPHLLTGRDGEAIIEFNVPDSVTAWNVWVHAVTRDMKSGSIKKEARTVKDLMVRPYLPRFLREGDQAVIKVVVNNASEKDLSGRLFLDIIDPRTEESIRDTFGISKQDAENRPFTVRPGAGSHVNFKIKAPPKVGPIAFKVLAQSGGFSDGELRPIPVLPGRMNLSQSRFVALKDRDRRELHFTDMAGADDPGLIHQQMVVTIDAQLFYSVLAALPYLVNYPYECTEQTLNRFISTGILASMYRDYPAVERMAKSLSRRQTRYETWDAADPNRKMALEETPWLEVSKGGPEQAHPLINVLDPKMIKTQRQAALTRLRKAQTSSGGFPWFPGGPPSPYMTLYILYGFSKGLEFGVEVPRDMIQRAWRYMHRHYLDRLAADMMDRDCCWEFISFLNYTLSNYPDASWTGGVFSEMERGKMLDFSFMHWKEHSPYLKGYLSLTLNRAGRHPDAVLVWESVMDAARTERDQGTFWAPEDRGWLWYNDTIETHAFAIRTLMELNPKEKKLDGLVLWIFLNKKLNHWKSTRATAEVIYSLAHYLKKTAQMGTREEIRVSMGDLEKKFVFLPEEYTGKKNQLVIPGKQIDPEKHSTIVVEKKTKGFALASATWHFSTEKLPRESRGDYLSVARKYFKRVKTGREIKLIPLADGTRLEPGDEVEVRISLTAKHEMEYVHLRDPRPAGFEPVSVASRHRWDLGINWYEEIRDSGTNFFFENLPRGNYPFKYRLRAAVAGTFKAAPATVQPMYAPEFSGYSSGDTIAITLSE